MTRVDLGGYEIAYDRRRSGTPVVFVSQLGEPGSDWSAIVDALREPAEVLTYDRGGIGTSDSRPTRGPHGIRPLAYELGALLDALEFPRPAVFVGHSIGAHVVRAFATARPDDVAGLVLVEASMPYMPLLPEDPATWVDGDDGRGAVLEMAACEQEYRAARFPQVPAVVVTRQPGNWPNERYRSEPGLDERWQGNQRSLAAELGAEQLWSARGGHLLTREDPALVARAVDRILAVTRERGADRRR